MTMSQAYLLLVIVGFTVYWLVLMTAWLLVTVFPGQAAPGVAPGEAASGAADQDALKAAA